MKKTIRNGMKKIAVLAFAVAILGTCMPFGMDTIKVRAEGSNAIYAQAKSKKASNRIRHKMYKAKVKALYKEYKRNGYNVTQIRYKFVDLNGDGLDEMLFCHNGFGPQLAIFTVYSKRVSMIWEENIRGGTFLRIYKKSTCHFLLPSGEKRFQILGIF